MCRFSPIIIIGMHRSGTTMLTSLLEKLGLFVGKKKESNNEAMFFLGINNWLFRECGGNWDNPKSIRYLINNQRARNVVVDNIYNRFRTPRVINYLGWRLYLRYRIPQNLVIPWGWKDPRNTFTLPIWLDLFPKAKVIHIYRHGVDVTNSLKVRAENHLIRSEELYSKNKWLYGLYRKRRVSQSLRCTNLSEGFSLWEEYVKEAKDHVKMLGSNALEVRYEDFLAAPQKHLKNIVYFCGLELDEQSISQVVHGVNSSRAFAYQRDPELASFAEEVSNKLNYFGYESS